MREKGAVKISYIIRFRQHQYVDTDFVGPSVEVLDSRISDDGLVMKFLAQTLAFLPREEVPG